jgi:hypothetical protein
MELFGAGRDELPLICGPSARNSYSRFSLASDEPELVPPDLPLGLVHPQAREKKLQEPL